MKLQVRQHPARFLEENTIHKMHKIGHFSQGRNCSYKGFPPYEDPTVIDMGTLEFSIIYLIFHLVDTTKENSVSHNENYTKVDQNLAADVADIALVGCQVAEIISRQLTYPLLDYYIRT